MINLLYISVIKERAKQAVIQPVIFLLIKDKKLKNSKTVRYDERNMQGAREKQGEMWNPIIHPTKNLPSIDGRFFYSLFEDGDKIRASKKFEAFFM